MMGKNPTFNDPHEHPHDAPPPDRSPVIGPASTINHQPSTIAAPPNRRAVFLDRDGVLNYNRSDYVKSPEELVLLPGSAAAVARLCAAGWPVFLISNQAGIARGVMTAEDLEAVTGKLERALVEAGGALEAIYYCRHRPDAGCDCRKPRPGMLLRAAAEHGLDLAHSFFVGDDPRDVRAGAAAGVPTLLVLSGVAPASAPEMEPRPIHVSRDLAEAVDWILTRESHP
jgi:D-glycero-D-manno-heptose 1,7-bisphosphate phosphatase